MSWSGVVWREAGNYGPMGMRSSREDLGRHTFPDPPEVGMILEIRGEDYRVTSVDLGFCYVRPMRMKAR